MIFKTAADFGFVGLNVPIQECKPENTYQIQNTKTTEKAFEASVEANSVDSSGIGRFRKKSIAVFKFCERNEQT